MLQRLDVKLVLAAISGALVGLIAMQDADPGKIGWVPSFFYFYGVSGSLFAISILWPYLQRDGRFLPKAFALVGASVLSFWCALHTPDHIPGIPAFSSSGAMQFIVASIIGAGIVFIAAKYIVPFKWSLRYLLLGLIAGVVGGWAFDALQNAPGPGLTFSFIAWHCIVCAALHFGTPRSAEPKIWIQNRGQTTTSDD
jgi:uncharacterized membrane protein YeaQ/YmgE (transglycosylase-associated protein family)